MRSSITAALLIAGWYLMIPPAMGGGGYDSKAPLSQWFVYGAYDTAHECEGAKFLGREQLKQKPHDKLGAAFESAQCIATDDPRLRYGPH
jgi:hypothetical protein